MTITTVAAAPSVSLVKVADASTGDTTGLTVGETINYSYVVTNTGNVDLASVAVDAGSLGAVTCPMPASPGLAPGASVMCTADATKTVTQADVDAGNVSDTASATGTDTTGGALPASPPSSVVVPQPAAPSVAIEKTATVTPAADQGGVMVGDAIAYAYVVTNTGNVDLASVAVDDPTVGAVSCPTPASPGLAPGASETCIGDSSRTVTQADVDAGSVTDTATAVGTDTAGGVSPVSSASTATVPAVAPKPAVSLVKIADASTGDTSSLTVGETINYSYVVTNTGNVDLASVAVVDQTLGAVTCPTPASPGLAPGASVICTADTPYTVAQTDLDAGIVSDAATATGVDTDGDSSLVSSPSTVVVPQSAAPAVSLDKTAAVTPAADQGAAQVGDTIAYSYVVTNIGNVDLPSVAVDDPTVGAVSCPTPASPGLAPASSEACSADTPYTVTQADVDAGKVVDTATATGTDTTGDSSHAVDAADLAAGEVVDTATATAIDTRGDRSPPSDPSTSTIPVVPAVVSTTTTTTAPPDYRLVGADGGVFVYGDSPFEGSLPGIPEISKPIVGAAATTDGGGYWLVASDGSVFAFGDAQFHGTLYGTPLATPIVGIAGTPDNGGYWLAGADGAVYPFGDAAALGSLAGKTLAKPIVDIAAAPTGQGFWLVGADGGVFGFGSAAFLGSLPSLGIHPAAPIVGMWLTPDGKGYWLVGSDGGVFALGDAGFFGSASHLALAAPIVGLVGTPDGQGYWLVGRDGGVFAYGDAPYLGNALGLSLFAPITSAMA